MTSNDQWASSTTPFWQFSPDRQVARFRQEVLYDAGFEVVSVHTESAARYEIYLSRCGVLLLCHKLTREAQESLTTYYEERCPEPYIVAILDRPNEQYPPHPAPVSYPSRFYPDLLFTSNRESD
jgi:hypothetical protein